MGDITPNGEEFLFEDGEIICQTDIDSLITYVNRKFCEVSGYKLDEVMGLEYKNILHPDMPSEIYFKLLKDLNSTLSANEVIKNITKDGLYYWSNMEIIATKNDNGEVVGFISVSKPASKKDIEKNSELFEKMLKTEKN